MTTPVFFHDEVQYVTYSDSPRNGPRVTMRLQDRKLLDRFEGKDGKRFVMVLVEIGDDEQPVPQPGIEQPSLSEPLENNAPAIEPALSEPAPAAHHKGGRMAREAGILCKDRGFQRQVELDHPDLWPGALQIAEMDKGDLRENAAAWVIRTYCGIDSRAELDHDEAAREKFRRGFWLRWIETEAGI